MILHAIVKCSSVLNVQDAAGLLVHIREHESAKLDNPRPQDLSVEVTLILEKLMLAQAQVRVWLHRIILYLSERAYFLLEKLVLEKLMLAQAHVGGWC